MKTAYRIVWEKTDSEPQASVMVRLKRARPEAAAGNDTVVPK